MSLYAIGEIQVSRVKSSINRNSSILIVFFEKFKFLDSLVGLASLVYG